MSKAEQLAAAGAAYNDTMHGIFEGTLTDDCVTTLFAECAARIVATAGDSGSVACFTGALDRRLDHAEKKELASMLVAHNCGLLA